MTTTAQTNRTSVIGSGTMGQVVSFGFPIADASDLTVIARVIATGLETPLTITTDYAVAISTPPTEGGTVTLVAAWASTYQIHVIRSTPTTQELDLQSGGNYDAASLNGAYDKLTRIVIDLSDEFGRCVKIPSTDPAATVELPNSTTRANAYLYFDSQGNITPATNVSPGTLTASTFWTSLALSVDAAATLTGLGINSTMQTVTGATTISSALTALGAGAFGKTLLGTANVGAALTALETANTVGTNLLASTTQAGAQSVLGLTIPTGISLLSSTSGVDMHTTGVARPLYTAPTGKFAIVTHVVVYHPQVSTMTGGTSFAFGVGSTPNDWQAYVDLSNVTTGRMKILPPSQTTPNALVVSGATFGMIATIGTTGSTTATIDVFGYLVNSFS